jgi:methylmalonyl-CoA mutase
MEKATEPKIIPLAEGFDEAGREDWTALVETALKGRPIDKVLNTPTYEGVTLNPLYRRDESARRDGPAKSPGGMDFTRGPASLKRNSDGWDIRQVHAHPDPETLNRDIKADLAGGATSVALKLEAGAGRGSAVIGTDGLVTRRVDDLDKALAGVDLGRTAIALQPGEASIAAAAAFIALVRRRGVDAAKIKGTFGADPLGALAEAGKLAGPLDRQIAALGALASWSAAQTPGMRAVWVDTGTYHAAGATETQDLAFAIATAVAYLRAMTAAGMSVDAACREIGFTLSIGTDVFQAIAKLRAARRLWDRVAEASGASVASRIMALGAVTAARAMSSRDTWVNVLRATCSCFAAGVGGADSITVRTHTDALGLPEPLARRVARNIQTILVQESSLARVADPAGGAYYVEQLSDEYARRAWAIFQEIEAGGGMAEALLSGRVATLVGVTWSEREQNLAHRRDALTGVSSFPDLDEEPSGVASPNFAELSAIAERGRAGDGVVVPDGLDIEGLITAASNGASFMALSKGTNGSAVEIPALVQHRLGEAFEALRDASDTSLVKTGRRPTVFIAALGIPADYTARVAFSKSYLAAGGIVALEADVDSDSIGDAYRQSSADLAVICSSDTLYGLDGEACARALKGAGALVVVLAGRPGEREAVWRDAGVDCFIYAGDDMLATLQQLASEIGIIER